MDFLYLDFQAQLGVQPTGLGGLVDGVAGQAAVRQKGLLFVWVVTGCKTQKRSTAFWYAGRDP